MAQRLDFPIITNLGNINDPVSAQDAATKAYVDNGSTTLKVNGSLPLRAPTFVELPTMSIGYKPGSANDIYVSPYMAWTTTGASSWADSGYTNSAAITAGDLQFSIAGARIHKMRIGDVISFDSAGANSVTITNVYYDSANSLTIVAVGSGLPAVSAGTALYKQVGSTSFFNEMVIAGTLSASNVNNTLTLTGGGLTGATSTDLTTSVTGGVLTANLVAQGAVTPGAFPYANVTVNNKGIVTAVSSGTPITSIKAGVSGTARTGAVTLLAGTNVTLTDNADGSFTIASVGGGGSGGALSAVWSSNDSATKDQYSSPGTELDSGITLTLSTATSAAITVNSISVGGTSVGTGTVTGTNPYTITVDASNVPSNVQLAGGIVSIAYTQSGTSYNSNSNALSTVAPVDFDATFTTAWSASSYPFWQKLGNVAWTDTTVVGTETSKSVVISDHIQLENTTMVNSGQTTISVSSLQAGRISAGAYIFSTSYAEGTTVSVVGATSLTMSAQATATVPSGTTLNFYANAVHPSAEVTAGSSAITVSLDDLAYFSVGASVVGTGIPANTTVLTIDQATGAIGISNATEGAILTTGYVYISNTTTVTAGASGTTAKVSRFANTSVVGTLTGDGSHGAGSSDVVLNTKLPSTVTSYQPMFAKITNSATVPSFTVLGATPDARTTVNTASGVSLATPTSPSASTDYAWVLVPSTITASQIRFRTIFGDIPLNPNVTATGQSVVGASGVDYTAYGATGLSTGSPITFVIG